MQRAPARRQPSKCPWGALCIVAMLAAHARAAPDDIARSGSAGPRSGAEGRREESIVARPLVLDAGQLDAELVVGINMAPGLFAAPLAFSPDVWFGATDRLTVGVFHSGPSVDRFSPAATFCVRHEASTCPRTYRGSGLDARFAALPWLAPRARLVLRDVDPAKPALMLGALVRWQRGRFAITGDPYLQLGLANTDLGNRHALVLPIELAVQPLSRWQVALHTGFNSDLAVIEDGWHVPIAVSTRVAVTEQIDVGALFGFATLLGPQNTPKERAFFLSVAWRPQLTRSPPSAALARASARSAAAGSPASRD